MGRKCDSWTKLALEPKDEWCIVIWIANPPLEDRSSDQSTYPHPGLEILQWVDGVDGSHTHWFYWEAEAERVRQWKVEVIEFGHSGGQR